MTTTFYFEPHRLFLLMFCRIAGQFSGVFVLAMAMICLPAAVSFAAQVAPLAPAAKAGDRFGDWVFECAAIGEGQTLCSLSQTLVAKDSNQAIARFSLARDKKTNELSFSALAPLGVDLPSGINLTIDQNQPSALTILTCTQNGCLASIPINPKFLEVMKSGKALTVSFKFRGADKPALLAGSLNGLASGMNALGLK